MRMDKGKPFMHVKADDESAPTFSEKFLYKKIGKGDARFVLGIAEEYEHVIAALGPKAVRRLLGIKPRLVNRLGTGEKLHEWLEDAADEYGTEERIERQHPSQIIVDDDAAHAMWELLHEQYCSYFDPESDMNKDRLRLYHTLTDSLGEWEKGQRQKEQDKLPEKLKRKAERKAVVEKKRARRYADTELHDAAYAVAEQIQQGEIASPTEALSRLVTATHACEEAYA